MKMMTNKFTMNLVWHNCKTHPPKEAFNDNLIMSNGVNVFDMVWSNNHYYAYESGYDLENWWWADIKQTVRGELRFRE
jgi:hypothetical protein